jgi:hypothetical protein
MVMTWEVIEGWVWTVSDGGVFKRCGCPDRQTGRSLDTSCPRLGQRNHGSWYFDCAVSAVPGRGGRVRRGGYATRRDAVTARDALLNRMVAMWWLIVLRGLRRGEAAGLRWVDVDLDAKVVMIGQQHIAYGHTVAVGPPKTAASRRTIALDRHTVRLLREHRHRQRAEARAAGEVWQDASLAHAAGADLKAVQEQLGHTSIVLTADTYTSVLQQLHFRSAEATARLVLAAAAVNPARPRRRRPEKSAAAEAVSGPNPVRPKRSGPKRRRRKGRPRTPHARPTKIKTA